MRAMMVELSGPVRLPRSWLGGLFAVLTFVELELSTIKRGLYGAWQDPCSVTRPTVAQLYLLSHVIVCTILSADASFKM